VVITEGRNRQVRRMFESINRDVVFLKRTAIGDIKLGGLYRGNFRELKANESEYLKKI
jgi:pseudouridine synthase